MTCVFCTDVGASGELIYDDAAAWVLLHPDWSPRGHAMVVAKSHVENVADLAEDEWMEVARVWHRAERALLQVTGAERVMVLKLGIVTAHLHVHLYPMRATDDRAGVFAAFDGKRAEERDENFVRAVRNLLTPGPR